MLPSPLNRDTTSALPQTVDVISLISAVARVMLRGSGEGTVHIRDAVERVAGAYGATVVLLVLPDSILLVINIDEDESTVVIHDVADIPRLDQVASLRELVHVIERGELPAAVALQRLTDLEHAPPRYPAWLSIPGVALFALGFGLNLQPTWQEAMISGAIGALVGAMSLLPRKLPRLVHLQPFVVAVVVSTLVLSLYPRFSFQGAPITLMIPALLFYIPGDTLSAALLELAHGRAAAGAIRLINVLFQLLTMATGVVLGGILSGTHPNAAFGASVTPDFDGWVMILGWLLFAVGMVWCLSIRWRDFGWVVAMIFVAALTQEAATKPLGELGGTFAAAVVVAGAVSLLARRDACPPYLVMILGAVFVLTVGAKGLEGLGSIVDGDGVRGFTSVVEMMEVATALSLGLLAGNILASLVPRPKLKRGRSMARSNAR